MSISKFYCASFSWCRNMQIDAKLNQLSVMESSDTPKNRANHAVFEIKQNHEVGVNITQNGLVFLEKT